jgi:hypothetical protein
MGLPYTTPPSAKRRYRPFSLYIVISYILKLIQKKTVILTVFSEI